MGPVWSLSALAPHTLVEDQILQTPSLCLGQLFGLGE